MACGVPAFPVGGWNDRELPLLGGLALLRLPDAPVLRDALLSTVRVLPDPPSGRLQHGFRLEGPGGDFFRSWETSRGAFGFTINGRGIEFVGLEVLKKLGVE